MDQSLTKREMDATRTIAIPAGGETYNSKPRIKPASSLNRLQRCQGGNDNDKQRLHEENSSAPQKNDSRPLAEINAYLLPGNTNLVGSQSHQKMMNPCSGQRTHQSLAHLLQGNTNLVGSQSHQKMMKPCSGQRPHQSLAHLLQGNTNLVGSQSHQKMKPCSGQRTRQSLLKLQENEPTEGARRGSGWVDSPARQWVSSVHQGRLQGRDPVKGPDEQGSTGSRAGRGHAAGSMTKAARAGKADCPRHWLGSVRPGQQRLKRHAAAVNGSCHVGATGRGHRTRSGMAARTATAGEADSSPGQWVSSVKPRHQGHLKRDTVNGSCERATGRGHRTRSGMARTASAGEDDSSPGQWVSSVHHHHEGHLKSAVVHGSCERGTESLPPGRGRTRNMTRTARAKEADPPEHQDSRWRRSSAVNGSSERGTETRAKRVQAKPKARKLYFPGGGRALRNTIRGVAVPQTAL